MKLSETKAGAIIEVFVKPTSSRFEVIVENGEFVVRCTEEPVKGKVNKEIVREFSKFFHAKVETVSGFTSKQKKLLITKAAKSEVKQLLSIK